MRTLFGRYWRSTTLAKKIQLSFAFVSLPLLILVSTLFYTMFLSNVRYESMINSVVGASEFSRDFKKDFDYETYLLLVENKSVEESELPGMLSEAKEIVGSLRSLTDSPENQNRLNSIQKYLYNLESYTERIITNIRAGGRYEDNLRIWENDVQIVTALIRDTIADYIYYEVKELQTSCQSYQELYSKILKTFIIAFILVTVLQLFASAWIARSITRPLRDLSEVTDKVAKGDLSVHANMRSGVEMTVLSESLNTMIDKLRDLISQVKEEQDNLRKAEFEVLQAQINPHFLYNTLDAIVWLAEAGEQREVVNMVGNLSDFFRFSLNQGKAVVSIKEELAHVGSYLKIQQIRYQDILRFTICVPEELSPYRIPKITLQPLVENALYHGIKNKRGGGRITISGEKFSDHLELYVTDEGIGMDEKRLNYVQHSIQQKDTERTEVYGLYNVNERIRLHCGEAYGISIESVYGEGTRAIITLPLLSAEKTVKKE